MALEKRDPNSKTAIFIPTNQEKSARAKSRMLSKKLKDIEELELRLQKKLDELDKK